MKPLSSVPGSLIVHAYKCMFFFLKKDSSPLQTQTIQNSQNNIQQKHIWWLQCTLYSVFFSNCKILSNMNKATCTVNEGFLFLIKYYNKNLTWPTPLTSPSVSLRFLENSVVSNLQMALRDFMTPSASFAS